jgi:hypothetical protein
MVRRALVAALLCLAALALVDGAIACRADAAVPMAGAACATSAPGDAGDPDRRWDAPRPSSASIDNSLWKLQLHHVESADGGRPIVDAVQREDPRRRGTAHVSRYLRHTPLLI